MDLLTKEGIEKIYSLLSYEIDYFKHENEIETNLHTEIIKMIDTNDFNFNKNQLELIESLLTLEAD